METKDIFAGVEIDVVFNVGKGAFFVYHPPVADIGLSLEEYLKAANSQPALRIWFDWQNASPELFHAALTELLRLDRLFNLKRRIVVGSAYDQVFPDLRELRQQGFFHSYYLPTDEIIPCAESGPTARCEELAGSIDRTATLVGADAISFDARGNRFVQAHAACSRGSNFMGLDIKQPVEIVANRAHGSVLGVPHRISVLVRLRMSDVLSRLSGPYSVPQDDDPTSDSADHERRGSTFHLPVCGALSTPLRPSPNDQRTLRNLIVIRVGPVLCV